jgi:hypothetical protein
LPEGLEDRNREPCEKRRLHLDGLPRLRVHHRLRNAAPMHQGDRAPARRLTAMTHRARLYSFCVGVVVGSALGVLAVFVRLAYLTDIRIL